MKTTLLFLSVFLSLSLFGQSTYFDSGNEHWKQGEYQEAIDDYTSAIKINPDDADAYVNRGAAYHNLGKHQEAIDDFNTAIKINPNYAKAYYNRGMVCKKLGRYQEAIADYTTAIKINPDDADAYVNRGISKAYLSIDCCRDFKRACELGNESGCRNFKIVNCH